MNRKIREFLANHKFKIALGGGLLVGLMIDNIVAGLIGGLCVGATLPMSCNNSNNYGR